MIQAKGWVLIVRRKALWHLLRTNNKTACSCWRWPQDEEVETSPDFSLVEQKSSSSW